MSKPAFSRPWWLLPPGRLHPFWWIGFSALLLVVDYVTDLFSLLPAVYVIPVTLAAWYSGLWPAMALAVATPLAHLTFLLARGASSDPLPTLIAMTVIRGAVIMVMALWFARLSKHELELERRVQTLEGLLTICSFCKNIRTTDGKWERLEKVISERSEATFSHGYCPDCIKAQYPGLNADSGS